MAAGKLVALVLLPGWASAMLAAQTRSSYRPAAEAQLPPAAAAY